MYNSGLRYNSGILYNQLQLTVVVQDLGAGTISSTIDITVNAPITGTGDIGVTLSTVTFTVTVFGAGAVGSTVTYELMIQDAGTGAVLVTPEALITIVVLGGVFVVAQVAKQAFLVDANQILQPLDVWVLQDSRFELMPTTRDYFEVVPGRHGEIDFGSEFEARNIELQVANRLEFNFAQREAIRSSLASLLSPIHGPQGLVFADDPDKTYLVRTVGNIELVRKARRFMFSIPFRCSSAFIFGTWEKQHTGSGILTNSGTAETPFVVEISGPVTNPSLVVAGRTMTYIGGLIAGDRVVINTENLTVTLNGINAVANFNGVFPRLQPGDNSVTAAAAGNTVWRWRDRWI